jgi:hypothetical protein
MNDPDRALDHGVLAAEIERGASLPASWYTDSTARPAARTTP